MSFPSSNGIRTARVFRSLSTRILIGFLLVATIPVAAVAVLNRWFDERATLEDARIALAEDASIARAHAEDHLAFHRQAIGVLAHTLASDMHSGRARIDRQLQTMARAYTGFTEVTLFDAKGVTVASTRHTSATAPDAWPSTNAKAQPFFEAAAHSDSTITTGVIRDCTTLTACVALAHAVRNEEGALLGVVRATLFLPRLADFGHARFGARQVVIVDAAGVVGYATPGLSISALDTLTPSSARARGLIDGSDAAGGVSSLSSFDDRSRLVASQVLASGWRIYVARSLDTVWVQLQARRSALLLAAVVGLVLGVIVAVLLAEQVRAPIHEMSAWLRAFDMREPQTQLPSVASSTPEELLALHDTVTGLATRLHSSYKELEYSIVEKEALNHQLNGVLRELDARVAARTSELQEALRRAHEASVTKSHFLANMSHELRTPLNSIIGFSSVLLKNRAGKLGKGELEMQERVLANGRHLLTLINDILDISKIEAGHTALEVGECDVIALVLETLSQLGGQIAVKPIALRYDGPDLARPLTTDAGKLRQILINLVGNAVKFTEEGEVVVKLETRDDGCVSTLQVRDSGIGIPPERLEAIFQPFEQADTSTSRKFGGTGLGLAISRSLSEMIGAQLTVASEPGVGSTFTLAFVDAARIEVMSDARKRAREAVRGILIA